MTYKEEREAYNKLSSELCDKDEKYKINIKVITPDMHTTNFVYLTNCWILFLDRLIYIICIFLTFGQVYKWIISFFIPVKKIKIIKVISNHYDLTQNNSFFNIQPVVKLFGEDIKFDRQKYAFKEDEGLEITISENNPLTKDLIEHDSKTKEISMSFQILENDDYKGYNKKVNGENNNSKDNNNNNENNNNLEMTNYLETPLHE